MTIEYWEIMDTNLTECGDWWEEEDENFEDEYFKTEDFFFDGMYGD